MLVYLIDGGHVFTHKYCDNTELHFLSDDIALDAHTQTGRWIHYCWKLKLLNYYFLWHQMVWVGLSSVDMWTKHCMANWYIMLNCRYVACPCCNTVSMWQFHYKISAVFGWPHLHLLYAEHKLLLIMAFYWCIWTHWPQYSLLVHWNVVFVGAQCHYQSLACPFIPKYRLFVCVHL